MFDYELTFHRKEKGKDGNPDLYWFEIRKNPENDEDEERLYFYTYRDLSGFKPHYSIGKPIDFIMLGIIIISEKQKISEEVKKNR